MNTKAVKVESETPTLWSCGQSESILSQLQSGEVYLSRGKKDVSDIDISDIDVDGVDGKVRPKRVIPSVTSFIKLNEGSKVVNEGREMVWDKYASKWLVTKRFVFTDWEDEDLIETHDLVEALKVLGGNDKC